MISKISGIIPTSARIESADFKSERPVRSGVPNIGQPVSMASRRGTLVQSDAVGGLRPSDLETVLDTTGPKSDEDIVQDLSEQFFSRDRSQDALGSEGIDSQKPTGGSLSIRV